MSDLDVYSGNHFSVEQAGTDWAIWRYSGDTFGTLAPPEIERLILTTDAMDELRDYFAESYPEDRAAATAG